MSWLQDFYKQNNIGGAGGVLDQAAIDYWEGEAANSDPESIKSIIKGTAQAQGTWNQNPITITPQAAPTFTPAASTSSPPSTAGQNVTITPSSQPSPTYSPSPPDPTPIESNNDWIQDAYTSAGLGQADQAGLDYWSGNLASGIETQEQIESNIALHSPQYKGKEETAYTRTVPAYAGPYDKDSKNQRTAENEYHQNILDEITRHVEQSGIGDFTKSEGSIPQWMPVSEHDDSYDLDQYRNQSSRVTEDLWQQGQIGDLEAWAQSVAGDYGLSFEPSEVYSKLGKDGKESRHTNDGMRRNISQSTGIENVVDFISKLDAAKAPEIAANKESMSNIYGAEIDETYNELFETDAGIDQAGKEYWTKDLLENRPGLTEGQDWQVWLEDAFKNTNEYKDFKVGKGPEELDIPGVGDDGQFIDFEAGAAADPAPDFNAMLADAKKEWDLDFSNSMNENNTYWSDQIGGLTDSYQGKMDENNTYWSNQIGGLTDNYTKQINSLQGMLAESSKNNADILKGYQDQVASYQKSLESQAAYGERPSNQSVKGVKTRNELPGYKPKTGGTTGHFNRKGSRLSTSSLNIA